MPMSCPNCQASDAPQWVGQKNQKLAVITAAVTLFLAFMCLILFSSWVMAGIAIAVVLFLGWVVRKSFQRKSNAYQCTKCQYVFNP